MNEEKNANSTPECNGTERSVSKSVLVAVACLVAALSILFTYTFTSASKRQYYSEKLAAQQQTIDRLNGAQGSTADFTELALIAELFNQLSGLFLC